MELELGLGISKSPRKIQTLKELDLINFVNCKGNQASEDDNSSNLSCQSSVNEVEHEELNCGKKKRGFNEIIEVESCDLSMPKTLPLLLWDKHPNEDDKLPKRLCNSNSFTMNNKNEGESVVGWPPIKSYRKKHNDDYQHRHGGNVPAMENGGRGGGCGGLRSMFVKVQMEGNFITRKIDLKLYHSYDALLTSLLTMFSKEEDNMNDYELTYQDGDGDWMLAGDVPWSAFVESVQRLKLRKGDD